MSLGGAVLNWGSELWEKTDDVLDITQRETGEFVSESIGDIGSGFRATTINLLSRHRS